MTEKSHLSITSHFVGIDTVLDYITIWRNWHTYCFQDTLIESTQLSFLKHFDGIIKSIDYVTYMKIFNVFLKCILIDEHYIFAHYILTNNCDLYFKETLCAMILYGFYLTTHRLYIKHWWWLKIYCSVKLIIVPV